MSTKPGEGECGWPVATNQNNLLKRAIIKLAAEVAGLAFGKDTVIDS